MKFIRTVALAAVVQALWTANSQSQDLGILYRPVAEFRRTCTSKHRSGHFERSGASRYTCILPKGNRATALTVQETVDDTRVIGVVYEAFDVGILKRGSTMTWLTGNKGVPEKLVRKSRGSDGCVFAEWRSDLTTTVLLRCARKSTLSTMLLAPADSPSSLERMTKIE